jgi:ribosomal protein S1
MQKNGQVSFGKVSGSNKGGITADSGRLRGFVPGSHLWAWEKRRVSAEDRKEAFRDCVGQELPFKVIEVDRSRRRLILSERLARRQLREEQRDRLMDELVEGKVAEAVTNVNPGPGRQKLIQGLLGRVAGDAMKATDSRIRQEPRRLSD